jgi:antitoxin component HigA of HigAB toxin-antitoxin module
MTAADLSKLLGVHRTLGPMILRGERKLTLKHVKTLANYFALSTDAFVD